MVRFPHLLLFCTLLTLISCGKIKKIWNEQAVDRSTLNLSKGVGCSKISKILTSHGLGQSSQVDCYENNINDAWRVIDKEELSFQDIEKLVSMGVIDVTGKKGDYKEDLGKLKAIFDFLGIKESIKKEHTKDLIDWFRENIYELSSLYEFSQIENAILNEKVLKNISHIILTFTDRFIWVEEFDVVHLKKVLEKILSIDNHSLSMIDASSRFFGLSKKVLRENVRSWAMWTGQNSQEIVDAISYFQEQDLPFEEKNHNLYLPVFEKYINQVSWNKDYEIDQFEEDISLLFSIDEQSSRDIKNYVSLVNLDNVRGEELRSLMIKRLSWWKVNIVQVKKIVKRINKSENYPSATDLEELASFTHSFAEEISWDDEFKFDFLLTKLVEIFPSLQTDRNKIQGIGHLAGLDYGNLSENIKKWSLWVKTNHIQIDRELKAINVSNDPFIQYKNLVNLSEGFFFLTKINPNRNLKNLLNSLQDLLDLNNSEIELLISWGNILEIKGPQIDKRIFQLISFAKKNWDYAHEQYLKVEAKEILVSNYSDLSKIVLFIGRFLGQMNETKSSELIAEHIIKVTDHQSRRFPNFKITTQLLDVALDILRTTCPSGEVNPLWRPQELSQCLNSFEKVLKEGAVWFNYAFDRNQKLPEQQELSKIKLSVTNMEEKLVEWFRQPNLSGIHTKLWTKLASEADIDPPQDILDGLKIFRKFGSISDENFVQASAFSHVAKMWKKYEIDFLDVIPEIVSNQKSSCEEESWKQCRFNNEFLNSSENSVLKKITSIVNTNYGYNSRPINGSEISNVLTYNIISEQLIKLFDADKDGLVQVRSDEEDDEVISMIVLSLNGINTLKEIYNNFKKKHLGEVVVLNAYESPFNKFQLKGLARLITLAGTELLVKRDQKQRNILLDLINNVINIAPKGAVFLDHKGIAAVVTFMNSLTDYRAVMLKELLPVNEIDNDLPEEVNIEKKLAISLIRPYLQSEFPRIHKWCEKFNYNSSCGVFFSELVNLAQENSNEIAVSSLDYLTITAAMFEGVLDSCDWNNDEKLSFNILRGNDELTCTTKLFTSLVRRLTDSKIVNLQESSGHKVILDFLNLHELTRVFGKFAMIKGTTKGILYGPINIPWYTIKGKKANLGSLIALFADIVNPKAARAARKTE